MVSRPHLVTRSRPELATKIWRLEPIFELSADCWRPAHTGGWCPARTLWCFLLPVESGKTLRYLFVAAIALSVF